MEERLTTKSVRAAYDALSEPHRKGIKSGRELHDRQVFISRFLTLLGYDYEKNLLVDISQSSSAGSRAPDIRVYGLNELKTDQSHAQLVIETKNFNLYGADPDQADLLQLKRYIIANRSMIRVIAATDYRLFIAYNASLIKREQGFRGDRPDSVSQIEREIFIKHRYLVADLANPTAEQVGLLRNLSHERVFEKQAFLDPNEAQDLLDISDGEVRNSFIHQLFHVTRLAEAQLQAHFEQAMETPVDALLKAASPDTFMQSLSALFAEPGGDLLKSFVFWGVEMNFLPPFLIDHSKPPPISTVMKFLQNGERREAFVLASVYSLINKAFFLRTLEDTRTSTFQFVEGEGQYAGRYISDGVLSEKYREGEQELVSYLRDIFKFQRRDLQKYDFLLRRDEFSWVLEFLDSGLLVQVIRLFNDVWLQKLNQDILGDIYEHYLEQDREQGTKSYRQVLGQYYTPKPVVRLMWTLTREVLKETRGRDLAEPGLPFLDVLDPCYGSATFLNEAVLHVNAAHKRKTITKAGKVFGFINDRTENHRLEEHLVGFELNPLSKSIADVNLFFAMIQAYGPASLGQVPIRKLNLFRTDSMDLPVPSAQNDEGGALPLSVFSEEVQRVVADNAAIRRAKRRKYDVVIANPPYAFADDSTALNRQLIPFAVPAYNFDGEGQETSFDHSAQLRRGKIPDTEANRGKLRDLYALFFGVADQRLSDGGILTYITSNTWLAIPTYKFFRKYFLENYTIHYIVNFNNISDRNSIFQPDAGIATAVVVMTRRPPPPGHRIRYLDLSEVATVKEKFEAFCHIKWMGAARDRRDISSFELKPISSLPFEEAEQAGFLERPDYILRISTDETLAHKLEEGTKRISEMMPSFQGIITGGPAALVAPTRQELREKIESQVFTGRLDGIGQTLTKHVRAGLKSGAISTDYDPSKEFHFAFQKDFEEYSQPPLYWTYMDHAILWRSRMFRRRKPAGEIFEKHKLFVLERREQSRLLALVTRTALAPQQGGRFFYFVPRNGTNVDDLYVAAAMINSATVNYYYRTAGQGNKDVRLKPIDSLPSETYDELLRLSRDLHDLHDDMAVLRTGGDVFSSEFCMSRISPLRRMVGLLDGHETWTIVQSGSTLVGCQVDAAWLDEHDPRVVHLNVDTRIDCTTPEVARALLAGPLAGFSGDLFQTEVVVDVEAMTGSNSTEELVQMVIAEVARQKAAVDAIVAEVYGLSAEDCAEITRATADGQ